MKNLLFFKLLFLFLQVASAQNTNISGVINTYQSVSNLTNNTLTVGSTAGFLPGDLILLIQMQGTTIDENNTAAFGDVVNYNSGGHYELLTVCDIPNGTDLSVSSIQRTYDPAGIVQVVRVPVYDDATITGTLAAAGWDGSIGGVLALKCNGDLTFNDDIDVHGAGFNGGAITTSTYTCQWWAVIPDYHTDILTGYGAMKGEGNALYIPTKTAGRGSQANGGGGGNDHNSGGGGGGNGGAGGAGGDRIASSSFTCSGQNPGMGGKAQTYNNAENRIFLGGGGGAGHENNVNTASPGANGGGIVIVIANRIIGNNQSILANGAAAATSEDGAGGGGAGGTVLLDVGDYTGMLNVNISGADGGDVANVGTSNCNGPGGGGGGGVMWTSQGTTPAGITVINAGGGNGTTTSATQGNCTVGGANNASPGSAGIELNNLVIPPPVPAASGLDVVTGCEDYTWIDGITYFVDTTGVVYTYAGGASNGCDSTVTLDLTITAVDTSVSHQEFYLIATGTYDSIQWFMDCTTPQILAGETDDSLHSFAYGPNAYLAVIYGNGCADTTKCFYQFYEDMAENEFSKSIMLYPNPSKGLISLKFGEVYPGISVDMLDLSGRQIQSWDFEQKDQIQINPAVASGTYLIVVKTAKNTGVKFVIME